MGMVKTCAEPESLLPIDIDLVVQSGSINEENERLVLDFIKKSKANRRRRQRYAEKQQLMNLSTPSVFSRK